MAINQDEYIGISSPTDSDGHKKVNSLKEEESWETGIYQIEKNDLLVGGEKGLANLQAEQLANRTGYLKEKLEQADQKISDSIKKSARIKNLENMVMELYEAKVAESKAPTGYSGVMVETFAGGADEIDKTEADVISVASDGTYADVSVSDGSKLAVGNTYQFMDADHTEEARIKSIDIVSGASRVTFETPLSSHNSKNAKLCRSTILISDGVARGGSIALANVMSDKQTFTGTAVQKTIDFTKVGQFTIWGGREQDGQLVMGGAIIGVVLNEMGKPQTGFKQINADGDDLKQADLQ